MRILRMSPVLGAALFVATLAPAVRVAAEEPPPRPKIGLALGGGGARGTAHIGVIRVLEELHIPIDYVAGTSMGSIIGGLYSCGYTPDDMEKLIGSIHWDTLFRDAPERKEQSFRQKEDDFEHLIPFEFGLNLKKGGLVLPPGLIAGSKLGFVLENATLPCSSVSNFDQLRIPFRAVATDIQTGQPYVMSSGNLARVIRASMAIPAIFTPVEIDGHLLVDGGESENLPVQTVRAMGADIVIAVNVGSSGRGDGGQAPERRRDDRTADRPAAPAEHDGLREARRPRHHARTSTGYTSADFVKGLKMIPLGYKAADGGQGQARAAGPRRRAFTAPWKQRHDATLPRAAVHRRGRDRSGAGHRPAAARVPGAHEGGPRPRHEDARAGLEAHLFARRTSRSSATTIVEDGQRHILRRSPRRRSPGDRRTSSSASFSGRTSSSRRSSA